MAYFLRKVAYFLRKEPCFLGKVAYFLRKVACFLGKVACFLRKVACLGEYKLNFEMQEWDLVEKRVGMGEKNRR